MTDEELQALPKGAIVYEPNYSYVRRCTYNGEKPWYQDPATGENVYELYFEQEDSTTAVKASDLYANLEDVVQAIVAADKTVWPIEDRALAFFLKADLQGLDFGDLEDEVKFINKFFYENLSKAP